MRIVIDSATTDLCVPLCLAVVDLVAGLAVLEVEDGEEDVAVGPLRLTLHLRTQALLCLCKGKEGKLQFNSPLFSTKCRVQNMSSRNLGPNSQEKKCKEKCKEKCKGKCKEKCKVHSKKRGSFLVLRIHS